MLALLTDVSILVEAVKQTQYPLYEKKFKKKPAERNRFSELNKVEKAKTNYSVEFNNFPVPQCPHRRQYLRLLGRPFISLCEKVCGQNTFSPA